MAPDMAPLVALPPAHPPPAPPWSLLAPLSSLGLGHLW